MQATQERKPLIEPDLIFEGKKAELLDNIQSGNFHLSYSALKNFAKSPKHFIEYKMKVWVPTKAMIEGTAVHEIVLGQPRTIKILRKADQPIPEKDFRTKVNQEWRDQMIAEYGESKILFEDSYETVMRKADAVYSNEFASVLFEGGEKEKQIYWKRNGFDMRGFIDQVNDYGITELKMMQDIESLRRVQWTITDEWYDSQLVMYLDAIRTELPLYIVAVDNNYHIRIIKLNADTIFDARHKYIMALEGFKKCINSMSFDAGYEFHTDFGYFEI